MLRSVVCEGSSLVAGPLVQNGRDFVGLCYERPESLEALDFQALLEWRVRLLGHETSRRSIGGNFEDDVCSG